MRNAQRCDGLRIRPRVQAVLRADLFGDAAQTAFHSRSVARAVTRASSTRALPRGGARVKYAVARRA
eukprot:8889763-Lingulodinium_polyedra.AAC.1